MSARDSRGHRGQTRGHAPLSAFFGVRSILVAPPVRSMFGVNLYYLLPVHVESKSAASAAFHPELAAGARRRSRAPRKGRQPWPT